MELNFHFISIFLYSHKYKAKMVFLYPLLAITLFAFASEACNQQPPSECPIGGEEGKGSTCYSLANVLQIKTVENVLLCSKYIAI